MRPEFPKSTSHCPATKSFQASPEDSLQLHTGREKAPTPNSQTVSGFRILAQVVGNRTGERPGRRCCSHFQAADESMQL